MFGLFIFGVGKGILQPLGEHTTLSAEMKRNMKKPAFKTIKRGIIGGITMRKLILLISALLLGLFISTSFAVEVTLFDRTFTRNTGAPVVASGTFRAVSGLATVNLTNTEISSARVTINGVEVFGPSDFNQNIDNIEKKVTLTEGENSLTVLLKSGPMGAVRIQIHMPVEVKITLDEENRVSSMITPQGGTITAQGADASQVHADVSSRGIAKHRGDYSHAGNRYCWVATCEQHACCCQDGA